MANLQCEVVSYRERRIQPGTREDSQGIQLRILSVPAAAIQGKPISEHPYSKDTAEQRLTENAATAFTRKVYYR